MAMWRIPLSIVFWSPSPSDSELFVSIVRCSMSLVLSFVHPPTFSLPPLLFLPRYAFSESHLAAAYYPHSVCSCLCCLGPCRYVGVCGARSFISRRPSGASEARNDFSRNKIICLANMESDVFAFCCHSFCLTPSVSFLCLTSVPTLPPFMSAHLLPFLSWL